jgi:hypothetical protein
MIGEKSKESLLINTIGNFGNVISSPGNVKTAASSNKKQYKLLNIGAAGCIHTPQNILHPHRKFFQPQLEKFSHTPQNLNGHWIK